MTPEMRAEMVRLFHAEGWKKGTIAKHFGVHHSTVGRVLEKVGAPRAVSSRPSKIEPYLHFIRQTLEKYPKVNATRLHYMVKQRGYSGGVDHFRDIIRNLRPRPKGEAFLRVSSLPGEQAQVDWGHFGKLKIGDAERRLLAFVMVLSYSRKIFLRFYLGDDSANFIRGHVHAFQYFDRIPREILYDNLKTAVIERVDSAIRFNEDFLHLAQHYCFAPRPVGVAKPTSKGKVERSIQYVRSSFFAAREFKDLNDLNDQALAWCEGQATERKWPQDRKITVAEAFATDREAMLNVPPDPFPVYERKPVRSGKTPYVRFDLNEYSIPHEFVRTTLLVEATLETVRIVHGARVIAEHQRSFDRDKVIEHPQHIDNLVLQKRSDSRARGMTRLNNVAPSAKKFFQLAGERGHNMGRLTQTLVHLLELYGGAELEAVLAECVASGRIHSHAVRSALEQRRSARGESLPVPLRFLKDRRIDEITVRPKPLAIYDEIVRAQEDVE